MSSASCFANLIAFRRHCVDFSIVGYILLKSSLCQSCTEEPRRNSIKIGYLILSHSTSLLALARWQSLSNTSSFKDNASLIHITQTKNTCIGATKTTASHNRIQFKIDTFLAGVYLPDLSSLHLGALLKLSQIEGGTEAKTGGTASIITGWRTCCTNFR